MDLKVECPTGSGNLIDSVRSRTRFRAAYIGIFLRDDRPPARPRIERYFQTDPHWRDLMLFHEYFHGDSGTGSARAIRRDGPAIVTCMI